MAGDVVFLVDLVQDVGIIEPLLQLLHRRAALNTSVLVSTMFYQRDATTVWQNVLEKSCYQTGTTLRIFESEADALNILSKHRGFLVSASELTLPPHALAHQLLSNAPSSLVTVTLQHGFECVGFLHNLAHDRAHGTSVGFAAKVVCAWFDRRILKSLPPDHAHKLYVAGPQSVVYNELGILGGNNTIATNDQAHLRGMICENLQSVRLEAEFLQSEFIQQLTLFLRSLRSVKTQIIIRPHPLGLFATKEWDFPISVIKSEGLLYEWLDIGLDFAISPPSSIVFNMMTANIPVAIWQDAEKTVDVANYNGLPTINCARDWTTFVADCLTRRDDLLANQRRFLRALEIPPNVSERYLRLFASTP